MITLDTNRTAEGILGLRDTFFTSRFFFFGASLRNLAGFGLFGGQSARFSGLQWSQFG
jgi:hypothetical protein